MRYADALVTYLREQGIDWDEARIRAAAPIVQEKIGRLGEFPDFARFLFEDVEPDPALLDAHVLTAAADELEPLEPWDAASLEAALKLLCEHLEREAEDGLSADPRRRHGLADLARACTRASSCSGGTSRSPGCAAALRSRLGAGPPASSGASRRLTIVTIRRLSVIRAPGVNAQDQESSRGLDFRLGRAV